MRTPVRQCPVCFEPITATNRGMRVWVRRRSSPRHQWRLGLGPRDELVCQSCAVAPNAGRDGRQNLAMVASQEFTEGTEPAKCEQCGVPLLLRPSARRKHATCSTACRVRLYKAERVVPRPVTRCEGCGQQMRGRADRRYCSPACRQRAYRRRNRLRQLVSADDAAKIDTLGALTDAEFEQTLEQARRDGDVSLDHVLDLATAVFRQP